jgi:hypothetical protein
MKMQNGTPITSAAQWPARRKELVELFEREMYGRIPDAAKTIAIKWEVTAETKGETGGIPTITRTLVGHVDNSAYPLLDVNIEAELTTPKGAKRVPVIVEFFPFEFRGRFPPPPSPTWQEQVVAKGWAYAVLSTSTIQADNGAGLTKGIIGLVNHGQPRKPDDWGALRAWAWGAGRLMDFFESDSLVDAKQVAFEGHSRYGKATLATLVYEPRVFTGFVSSSGEGGAKVWRHLVGEQVESLAGTSEYHWMAGNFIKYAGPLTVDDLPADAHQFVALVAPRPIFVSGGEYVEFNGSRPGSRWSGESWQDTPGTFMATAGASSPLSGPPNTAWPSATSIARALRLPPTPGSTTPTITPAGM